GRRTSACSAPALVANEVEKAADRRIVGEEALVVRGHNREVAAVGGAEEILPERRGGEQALPAVGFAGNADVARAVAPAALGRPDRAVVDREPDALGTEIEAEPRPPEARRDPELAVAVRAL